MALLPLTRQQLWSMPLAALVVGPLASLGFVKWLGWSGALAWGSLVSAGAFVLATWIVYRSDFAARYGLLAAGLFLLAFMSFLGGGAVAVAHSIHDNDSVAVLALLGGIFTVAIPLLGSAWIERARLERQGSKGAWVQQHVDAKAGRMRADALLSNSPPPRQGLLWLVVGAAVNVPWVFRTQGITDAQMLPWALALFAAAVVWVAAAYMGPRLGRAVLLLRLERATKQRLVHEHFEDIQQLRRDFWLSRWLMPAEAALDEPPSKPEKRR
jgi:hypothetical protein